MRMDEVRVPRRTARGARERKEEERHESASQGRSPEIPHDPVPVREPEVTKRSRRDDHDVDPRFAQVVDRVRTNDAGDVVRPPRVRRRQDTTLIRVARRARHDRERAASATKT